MTTEFEYKELFNQYAVEAGRYLPRRKRKDIQLEIVSLLEDALEDISQTSGEQVDEAMAIEVLRSFGPPITYAEKYRQQEYLVGPAVFPLFKPVLILGLGLFLIQFVIGLFLGIRDGGFNLLNTVDNFFDMGFRMLGVLVFAFALIERTTPENWLRWPFKEMERTWDPKDLLANKAKQAVKVRSVIFDVIFLGAFVVFLVFFPHYVGVGVNRNGVWGFVPTLSESFKIYQLWIVAYVLVKMAFNIVLAGRNYWDSQMRWFGMAIRLFAIGLLFWMLYGPEMFGINPAYLAIHNPPATLLQYVKVTLPGWNTGFKVYLVIQLVIQLVQLIRDFLMTTRGQKDLKFDLQ